MDLPGRPAAYLRTAVQEDSLDSDEELPPLFPVPELGDGPGGRKGSVVFRKPNEQLILRNGRAARCASDMAGFPAKHLLHKSPGIPQGGLRAIRIEQFGDCACIDWRLTKRGKPKPLKEAGSDYKPDRLNVVQPFEVGVAIKVCGHGDHPETGQR